MPAPAATFHPLKLPLGSRHPLPRPWPRPPAQRPGQSGAQHGAILPNPRRAATIPSRALNDYTYSTGDHPFLVPRTGHSYAHEPALCRVQGRRRAGNFVRLGFIYSASSFAIFFRPGRLCLSSTLASSPSPPPSSLPVVSSAIYEAGTDETGDCNFSFNFLRIDGRGEDRLVRERDDKTLVDIIIIPVANEFLFSSFFFCKLDEWKRQR